MKPDVKSGFIFFICLFWFVPDQIMYFLAGRARLWRPEFAVNSLFGKILDQIVHYMIWSTNPACHIWYTKKDIPHWDV